MHGLHLGEQSQVVLCGEFDNYLRGIILLAPCSMEFIGEFSYSDKVQVKMYLREILLSSCYVRTKQ